MYAHGLSSFMVDDPYQGGFVATGEGRATSPSNGDRKMDAPPTYEQLIAINSSLKTRVSELEVIIELFRGRLSQLEQQEAAARTGQQAADVEQSQLRAQLEDSHRRENSLKRRLDELELEFQANQGVNLAPDERPAKRPRTLSDPVKTQAEADIEAAAEALLASEASRPGEIAEPAPAVYDQTSNEVAEPSEETKEASAVPETEDVPIDPDMPVMDETSQPIEEAKAPEDIEVPDAPATATATAPTDADAEAAAEASSEETESTEASAPATAIAAT
jgi:GATA-binding protein